MRGRGFAVKGLGVRVEAEGLEVESFELRTPHSVSHRHTFDTLNCIRV